MTQVELVCWWQQLFTKRKIVAAIISLPVKMLVAQTLTSGWGCRCEANTNVPGALRILDPPLDDSDYLDEGEYEAKEADQ